MGKTPSPRLAAPLVAAGVALALTPAATSAQGLELGLADTIFTRADATLRDTWLTRASDLGATIVRLDVGWPASRRPERPTDPADPAYDWSSADAAVDAARSHGLKVLLTFAGMPAWARTRGAPATVGPETWRPNAGAIGQYGQALAAHFAGRASLFQLWTKPNVSTYLTPQWSHGKLAAPRIYREMLDAFYAGVKRAQPGATVVTAGTGPFGDRGHGNRIRPVVFWRALLTRTARFDVLAQDMFSAGRPTRHARDAGDVAVPDMGKLRRLLEHSHVKARLWVTDAAAKRAHWLEHAFELFWRAGVDTVTVRRARDVFRGDHATAAAVAFRFPFVAGGDQVWTRAPLSGTLLIQRNGMTVTTRSVRAGQVLLLHGVRTRRGDVFRGVVGELRSLPWRATH